METALCIDFGSTFTKLTAIDLENETILGTSKSATTGSLDIMVGFYDALDRLNSQLPSAAKKYRHTWACSSAYGGLKMIAIGLVPELTAEAAKRAALGAGARVLKVYHNKLTSREMESIVSQRPDMVLLAGGTDGGNTECILHNAELLSRKIAGIPVILAGNKNAADEMEDLFQRHGIEYRLADNVLPRVQEMNVEPVREVIRELFVEKIVCSKGFQHAEDYVNHVLMPTPTAVLTAAQLLAQGTHRQEGIGDLMVVDIGGATTDVYSLCSGAPTLIGAKYQGLEEPYAKRTVEGDLGMRVSAYSAWETAGERRLRQYAPAEAYDWEARCRFLAENVHFLSEASSDVSFDEALASAAIEIAMHRHAGTVQSIYTPLGVFYAQEGKDLTEVKHVIGTGGVLIHSEQPDRILLRAALFKEEEPHRLLPKAPKLWIDKTYTLSAMGLLAKHDPDLALRMMKNYLHPA